ncbi:portal protein [Methylobacterium ajmalii]|uniref:Portal protein n=1 Tax=Methylobacterium ajmalii TaxID=2738439 RepID=A0ABU9ZT84_9HYPH
MSETETDQDAPGAEERAALDRDALMRKLKGWYKVDRDASSKWRTEATKDYEFAAGHQWSDQDLAILREQGRPPVTFNRILPVLKAVCGSEVNSRQDIQFLPREIGDSALNEVLTEASRYLAQESGAEDEESDAFCDLATCGLGCVEMRLDYEVNPDGAYVEDRVDPLEMVWDASARKRNLDDARRISRAKTMDLAEAREMFPDADPEDLDAAWAEDRDEAPHRQIQPGEHRSDRERSAEYGTRRVTIVEVQWFERVRVVLVGDPATGQMQEMEPEKAEVLLRRASVLGMNLPTYSRMKRVYKRAFVGNVVLEVGPGPAGDRFSYAFMTGDRDVSRIGGWFGLVRPMREPQRFANAWLGQTLDMLNRQAKGGLMMEKGAVPDQAEFEASYGKPGGVSWVEDGALRSGAIKEKPLPQLPAGHFQLMEFAISSIRDSSGVNLELLGMKSNDQAGVLEYQRKQAALTILATLFDALRRARKHIGRVRLFFIQTYLSDGRLVRIAGDGAQRVIPLVRDVTAGEYDVVIDDAPTSPNQKEQVWATFTSIFPVIKDMITPQVLLEILPYSPFPDSFVAKMRDLLANQGTDPQAEQQRAIGVQTAMAKIADLSAGANLKNAKAGREQALAHQDAAHAAVAHMTALAGPPQPAQPGFAPAA